jgi:hypothetical protein
VGRLGRSIYVLEGFSAVCLDSVGIKAMKLSTWGMRRVGRDLSFNRVEYQDMVLCCL